MAMPPVLPSQDNSSWHPTMLGPVGFAAPPPPHAPTAATDQGGAALAAALEQLEKQRVEAAAERERFETRATAERKEMREELAAAMAEIARLRDHHAEMRKDLDNARWGNSWGSAGWWTRGPQ